MTVARSAAMLGLIAAAMAPALPAVAATTGAALPPAPLSPGSLLQVLLGLALVVAAILVTALVLRRLAPGQMLAGGALRVVGGVMVGPRERVVVVEVQDTWLLLGVAAGSVRLLHTMPRPAPGAAAPLPADTTGMPQWLRRAFESRRNGAGR